MCDNDTTCPHEVSQTRGQLPAGLFRISWDFFYSDFNYLMSLYKLVPAYCEEVKVLKMHKGQNGIFFSSQHVFPFSFYFSLHNIIRTGVIYIKLMKREDEPGG